MKTRIKKYFSLVDNQRKYFIDGESYFGVTSILEATKAICMKSIFQKWETQLKLDYGLKKGEAKRELPLKVGTFTHAVIENQLQAFPNSIPQFKRSLACHFQPVLDEIAEVLEIEAPVYSKKHKYAGTVDAIVRFKNGKIIILDHKTANQKKTQSGIAEYRLQIAAYALAYYEMTGIAVDGAQINIIYRTTQGIRKPTRLDRFDVANLRKETLGFLARLNTFKAQQTPQEEESPW
jgi:hypothetical protein